SHLGQSQDRAQALAHELAQAQIEVDARAAREDARARGERELATDLVRLLSADRAVSETATTLAAAVDAHDPHDIGSDLGWRVREAITALDKRKRELADEAERMSSEIARLDQQLSEAKERATALESERDEMAASGKEIIGQLTQQREARETDLREARVRLETAAADQADLSGRLRVMEAANRTLAESLHALAEDTIAADAGATPGLQGSRIDLELALSQLPQPGETGIAVPRDLAMQLAQSGQRVAATVSQRQRTLAAALARASDDHQALNERVESLTRDAAAARTLIDQRDSELRRHQAEVTAVRKEIAEQAASLGTKVQELSAARSELASITADATASGERVRVQEAKIADLAKDVAAKDGALRTANEDLAQASRRAEDAEANQLRIAQALGSLTSWKAIAAAGSDFSDPITKAAQKLERAKALGGDEVSIAGRALVDAVQDRLSALADRLDEAQDQLSASKVIEAQLGNEVAGLKAALVDRDHGMQNAQSEIERAKEEHAAALSASMESRREADELAAQVKEQREQLRQALAELEGIRARGAASSGFTNDEIAALRTDLASRLEAAKRSEHELAELRERLEASDARMRRQREEFQRMIEERDQTIQQKDSALDEHGSKRVDVHGLQAQVKTLTDQLAGANERVRDLEQLSGVHAGVSVKSGDLARELKRAQSDRDALRERQRQLESDLADSASSGAELQAQLEEKRKEVQSLREQFSKEVGEERDKTTGMREEFRKLKEEVVGLRARLKRLTESR
ncbi:MAG: hypothetical protein H0W83_07205, partial [Planctomycetes bacterium]|nr:hypothetical protein [Planctomycetota bacterium]